jgi:hypothetical protein
MVLNADLWSKFGHCMEMRLEYLINWVIQALNADWLTAVVFQTSVPRV